jgi:hypothetical protein
MNEAGGGEMPPPDTQKQLTTDTIFSTTLFGVVDPDSGIEN